MKGLTDQKKKKNENKQMLQIFFKKIICFQFSLFFFSLILLSGHLSRGHQSWPQNKEKEYGRPRDLWKGIHLPQTSHFLSSRFLTTFSLFLLRENGNREGNVLWKIECFLEDQFLSSRWSIILGYRRFSLKLKVERKDKALRRYQPLIENRQKND